MRLLFRGAKVFDGSGLETLDVLVDGGKISAMAPQLDAEGAEVVRAAGCVLATGFTDLHVHLREPGYEEKETIASGTAAAAAGGFTTVCAMPNLSPVPDNRQHLESELTAIRKDARVRVLPYGALTMGERGEELADIAQMAPFVTGFSDDGFGVQSEELMRNAMREVALAGRFVAAHCEVEALIPKGAVCMQEGSPFARTIGYKGYSREAEWREVERNIRLSDETGCRLHICHASAAQSFELVRQAKQRGLPVTCEVTPHNLTLSSEDIRENDGRFKMNPPLRMKADVDAAVAALRDGTVDAIATDHAPHTLNEKAGGFAKSLNGVSGLETAFAACYTHLVLQQKITLEALLKLITWRPRGVLMEPRQYIAPGEEANLVLLDLETERVVDPFRLVSRGHATPFAYRRLRGWPVMTVLRDEILYRRE